MTDEQPHLQADKNGERADSPPRAERLMRMSQGYLVTALLRTGLELGIFDALAMEITRPPDIAELTKTDERGLTVFLDAAAAAGLIKNSGGVYSLTPLSATFLVRGHPGYLGETLSAFMSDALWEALRHLPDAVRTGGSTLALGAETPDHDFWHELAVATPTTTSPAASAIVRYVVARRGVDARMDVLDLACGHGGLGHSIAARCTTAHVWYIDWPRVLTVAEANTDKLGLRSRSHFLPGDAFSRDLGGPYDLALLGHVLHHFSEQRASDLLARVSAVVRPGGSVFVVDYVGGEADPHESPAPHLFAAILLAWTREGRVHTRGALTRMFQAAGFARPAFLPIAGQPTRLLVAERLDAEIPSSVARPSTSSVGELAPHTRDR